MAPPMHQPIRLSALLPVLVWGCGANEAPSDAALSDGGRTESSAETDSAGDGSGAGEDGSGLRSYVDGRVDGASFDTLAEPLYFPSGTGFWVVLSSAPISCGGAAVPGWLSTLPPATRVVRIHVPEAKVQSFSIGETSGNASAAFDVQSTPPLDISIALSGSVDVASLADQPAGAFDLKFGGGRFFGAFIARRCSTDLAAW